jgi:hypothetical protein
LARGERYRSCRGSAANAPIVFVVDLKKIAKA